MAPANGDTPLFRNRDTGSSHRRREKSFPSQNKSGQATGKTPVTKGTAAGDSGVAPGMSRLTPAGLLESYMDIANAALTGGCIPDSWKREAMLPIEKIEGVVKIEKHRPIMLIKACRKAYTGILIKRIRKVWDTNQAISPCNLGFAIGASTVEPITKPRMCIDQALCREKSLFLTGEDLINDIKAFESPERAIKDIAPWRLGVPESVVKFLASIDEEDEVHIYRPTASRMTRRAWRESSRPSVG